MLKSKQKYIVKTTESLHDNVAALYESLMDEENENAVKIISSMIDSLKLVKSNLL